MAMRPGEDDGTGIGWQEAAPAHVPWNEHNPLKIERSLAFSPTEHGQIDDFAGYDFSPTDGLLSSTQSWINSVAGGKPIPEPTFSPEIRRALAEASSDTPRSTSQEVELRELGGEDTKHDKAIVLSPPFERKKPDELAVKLDLENEERPSRSKRLEQLHEKLATDNPEPDPEARMPRYDGRQRLVGGQAGSSLGSIVIQWLCCGLSCALRAWTCVLSSGDALRRTTHWD